MNRILLTATFLLVACSGGSSNGSGGGGGSATGGGTGGGGAGGSPGGGAGGGSAGGGAGGGSAGGGGGAAVGGGGGSIDAGLGPGEYTRTLPAWPSRSYDLKVPGGYDGGAGYPVILGLHGGGGNRASQRKLGCPGGVLTSSTCFDTLASSRGFLVVFPDGTGAPLAPNVRTWNSGGGANGWQCVSGYACNQNIDEQKYFADLLADLATVVPVNLQRVYATGISNGAAMAERLACQFPQSLAAIAPVAGGNQYSTTQSCTSKVSVLEIHGTADPCWLFDGGTASCADANPGAKIGIPATLALWRGNDGCGASSVDTALPDTTADGMHTVKRVFTCSGAAVELYEVVDGGHTWPGGYGYSTTVGGTTTDFAANPVILDFFENH